MRIVSRSRRNYHDIEFKEFSDNFIAPINIDEGLSIPTSTE